MLDERERVLAQFQRRKGLDAGKNGGNAGNPDAAHSAESEEDTGAYQAYKAVDSRQSRLKIKSATHASEWVPYNYLLRIVIDPTERRLALIYTFMAITISGDNLGPLAEAVADERCEFVQEFAPRRWAKPDDRDAVIVESVEFIVDKSPMSAAENEDAA